MLIRLFRDFFTYIYWHTVIGIWYEEVAHFINLCRIDIETYIYITYIKVYYDLLIFFNTMRHRIRRIATNRFQLIDIQRAFVQAEQERRWIIRRLAFNYFLAVFKSLFSL